MKKIIILMSEIIIGILILASLINWGIQGFKAHLDARPTYTIEFDDVDGLNIGSPVRFMGMQIGNVIKLELFESKVYVTFRIADKTVTIPKDSLASVQFTGMAGSKSLEIMPPKFTTNEKLTGYGKLIHTQKPIRINSVIEVQTVIFENVLDFCNAVYSFLSHQATENLPQDLKKTTLYIKESNMAMEQTLREMRATGETVSEKAKGTKEFLSEQSKTLDNLHQSLDHISQDKIIYDSISKTKKTFEKLAQSANYKGTTENIPQIAGISQNFENINKKLSNYNKTIKEFKDNDVKPLSSINNSLEKTTNSLERFIELTKGVSKGSSALKEKDNVPIK